MLCKNCEAPVGKDYKFCGSSCAASYNNKKRVSEGWISPLRKSQAEYTFHLNKCLQCGNEFPTRRKKQKCCNLKCAGPYRERHRRAARTPFRNYQADCQFRFALNKYPDKFDFSLIEQFGWYSATNKGGNLQGVSRDHMLSIADGFDQGIDPEIIKHPANCKLIQQIHNSKKHRSSTITLEELMERIANFKK